MSETVYVHERSRNGDTPRDRDVEREKERCSDTQRERPRRDSWGGGEQEAPR